MKYFQRRRKEKLYRQWVERAGLPPEAIPHDADKAEAAPTRVGKRKAASDRARGPVQVQPGSSAVTHVEIAGDMMTEIDKRQRRLSLVPIVISALLVILCVFLILLIVGSC